MRLNKNHDALYVDECYRWNSLAFSKKDIGDRTRPQPMDVSKSDVCTLVRLGIHAVSEYWALGSQGLDISSGHCRTIKQINGRPAEVYVVIRSFMLHRFRGHRGADAS